MKKSKNSGDITNKEGMEMEITSVESGKEEVQESAEILPQLIKIEEFFSSVSRKYPIETLGGFLSWIKKDGMPRKLPFNRWQELLENFRQRKA